MLWRVAIAGVFLFVAPTIAAEVRIRNPGGDEAILYSASHALVLGAADYQDRSWNDLPRVPDEVDEVATTLRLQGFEVETVMDPDADTLRSAIRKFVTRYGMTSTNTDNRLLIFFSGHGHTRRNDLGYLVPIDAPDPFQDEQGFLEKALDMKDVMAWAEKIEAKHALFVFDSCFSGTLFQTKALPNLGDAYIRASTAEPVRQFITAGRANEEVPAESIFTPLFVKALQGQADTNNDNYVTGVELGLFLMQQVPDHNPAQTPQYGKIRNIHLDQGDFVFQPFVDLRSLEAALLNIDDYIFIPLELHSRRLLTEEDIQFGANEKNELFLTQEVRNAVAQWQLSQGYASTGHITSREMLIDLLGSNASVENPK